MFPIDIWRIIISLCSFEALFTLRLVCKKFHKEVTKKQIPQNLRYYFLDALEHGDLGEVKAIRYFQHYVGEIIIDAQCLTITGRSGSEKCIDYILDRSRFYPCSYRIINLIYGMVEGGHIDLAIKYRSHPQYIERISPIGKYTGEYWWIMRLCILRCYKDLFLLMRAKNINYTYSIKLLPTYLDDAPNIEKSIDFIIEHILIPLSKACFDSEFVYLDSQPFIHNLINLGQPRLIREAVDLKLDINSGHIYYAYTHGFTEIAEIIKNRNSRTSRKRRARKAKKVIGRIRES